MMKWSYYQIQYQQQMLVQNSLLQPLIKTHEKLCM
jgi:hypothetical protein